jgi:HK97 family phage prohead protease
MLKFDIDVRTAEAASRTITGVAVPYGETANLGGTVYTFTAGSLTQARQRTPLLLGHDRNRPIGVLVDLVDTPGGALARFSVDAGAEGDLALAQAASGSRGGLSIGAEIVDGTTGADGVVTVTAASLLEVSLVSIPAFAGADVMQVAADKTDESAEDDDENDPTIEDEAEATAEDEKEETDMLENETVAADLAAIPAAAAARPVMAADTYITAMVRAMKGDQNAARMIEASLDVIDTAAIVGLVPDQYLRQIIGGLADERPLANNVRRAPLPAEGMKLYKPIWTTTPEGGWISESDPTPSNAITIGNHEVEIEQWAYGVSMTVASLERGFGVGESVFRQIILDYYAAVEAKLSLAMTDAADAVAAGATILATIGLQTAEIYKDSGRRPTTAFMAGDVWAELLATEASLPFTGGQTTASGIAGQIAGLDIVVTGALADGTLVCADRNVIELRESAPLQLRANAIGTMNVELGVTSFASFDVEVPNAIKITSGLA